MTERPIRRRCGFILSLYLLFMQVPLALGLYVIGATLISTNLSANIEAVFRQPVSDALSLRAARYALRIAPIPFEEAVSRTVSK